jgi:hypothetical protein
MIMPTNGALSLNASLPKGARQIGHEAPAS